MIQSYPFGKKNNQFFIKRLYRVLFIFQVLTTISRNLSLEVAANQRYGTKHVLLKLFQIRNVEE